MAYKIRISRKVSKYQVRNTVWNYWSYGKLLYVALVQHSMELVSLFGPSTNIKIGC